MLKRTLYFTNPCHLSVQNSQLLIRKRDSEQEDRTVPIEDIGIVVLENPAITLGLALIQRLVENNVAVIFCDPKHMPGAMLLPADANHVHAEVLRLQIEAKLPPLKRLWQQTVQAKIRNQADLLRRRNPDAAAQLDRLAGEVRSDDADNREGVAARLYWQHLFGDPGFTRERDAPGENALLNYGYAILRAATARALVSSGLLCALGIHHRNRYNAYALADDMMEPYRAFVDCKVCDILEDQDPPEDLSPELKMRLLELLTMDTILGESRKPLMVALSSTTASLVRCLRGEADCVLFPRLP